METTYYIAARNVFFMDGLTLINEINSNFRYLCDSS